MGIFNFFTSKSDKQKLSHIKSLIALAMADGKVEKSELAAIAAVCSREGVTESELKNLLENPKSVNFTPPTDHRTKVMYLKDMCRLMMIDGNIDENEVLVCKLTAESLGFRHEVIEAMVVDIIEEIKSEVSQS